MDLNTRMRLESLSTNEVLRQREALFQERHRLRQQRYRSLGLLALGSLFNLTALVLANRWPSWVGFTVSLSGLAFHTYVLLCALAAFKERNL
jgi:hypothetical protein